MIKFIYRPCLILLTIVFTAIPSVQAEDFQCEVMSLEGSAFVSNAAVSHQPLKEGDLLQASDIVEVGSGSTLDLAYDKDWQNVTRLEENSKVEIRSLYPTTLSMNFGGVFAKLKALPRDSTFTVETPTAIAAARGTEYRTVTSEEGGTQVYNFSDSQVYVFGQDEDGKMSGTPAVVENAQVIEIPRTGGMPMPPRRMSPGEIQKGGQFQAGIEKRIQENIARGRTARVQDMKAVERAHRERMQKTRQGQGALTSLEQDQQKNMKIKELMQREDRLLQKMDDVSKASGQRRGPDASGRRFDSGMDQKGSGQEPSRQDQQPNGPFRDRGPEGMKDPGDQGPPNKASHDLKKNDQDGPINQDGPSAPSANKRPQPRRGNAPPPPKPPR